jgi:hypothetical protein
MTLSKPSVKTLIFVEFQISALIAVRICNSNVDRVFNGNTYSAHPELVVNLPALNGELPTSGPTLEVLLSRLSFVRALVKDRAYYPTIKARVFEVTTPIDSNTGDVVHLASSTIVSHRLKDGMATLTLAGPMQALVSDSSYAATPECNASFGDGHSCTVLVESLVQTGTILSHVNGVELTISGLSAVPLYYWMPGKLRRSGQSVNISYFRDGNTFTVSERIPQDWQDELDNSIPVVVEALPGCRRNFIDCKTLNPNPEQFKGYGISTPDRNPFLEVLDE